MRIIFVLYDYLLYNVFDSSKVFFYLNFTSNLIISKKIVIEIIKIKFQVFFFMIISITCSYSSHLRDVFQDPRLVVADFLSEVSIDVQSK